MVKRSERVNKREDVKDKKKERRLNGEENRK